ncbi:MAG: hypothetical protein ACLQQ4_16390 [Bacteroidia bacterium]
MKKKSLYYSIAAILLFNACTKQGAQGPAGPAGQSVNLTGTLDGIVTLYNEYGDKQPYKQCTSVSVILYNSSNAKVDSVNCDSLGKYSFNNIPTGDYSAVYKDTGYGEYVRIPFQNLGGGTIAADYSLSQIPNFTFAITNDSIKKIANDTQVVIFGTITAAPQTRYIAVFMGSSSSVNSTPGNYSGAVSTIGVGAGATTFSISIPINTIYMGGFPYGSQVFFMLYSAAYFYASQSEYTDLNTGQTVYDALGYSAPAPHPLTL